MAGNCPPSSACSAAIAAACNNADLHGADGKPDGDPTEIALLELATACGADVDAGQPRAAPTRAVPVRPTAQA